MENIIGYYNNNGEIVGSLDESDYLQVKLYGKYATNKYMLVDKHYLNLVIDYKWYVGVDGYPHAYFPNGSYKIYKIIYPNIEHGYVVDHINRNKLDNRLSNLRVCTIKQNSYNRSRINGKYKGVCKIQTKDGPKFYALVNKDGKKYKSTKCDTEKDAALLYDYMVEELFGEYAGKNFG
jgi:hypothetical protein